VLPKTGMQHLKRTYTYKVWIKSKFLYQIQQIVTVHVLGSYV